MGRIKLRAEYKKATGYPASVKDPDGYLVWNSEYVHHIETELLQARERCKELTEKYNLLEHQAKRCYNLFSGFVNMEYKNVFKEMDYLSELSKDAPKLLSKPTTGTEETPFVCPMCKHNQLKHLCTECEVQEKTP